jgi:cysteine desulfurase
VEWTIFLMTLPIYLDHNATSPLRPAARAAMMAAMAVDGNPSSVHGFGRAARRLMEDAREDLARLVRANPEDILFTSGATEANNALLRGLAVQTILVSATEHDSVLAAAPGAIRLPVDGQGRLDLVSFEQAIDGLPTPFLVSVIWVNNETGVIQPVDEIAAITRKHGGWIHLDAVQALGKVPVNLCGLDVDAISLSAHKVGGPIGIGALVLRWDMPLAPWQLGGGQERRRRAGTENIIGIAGFAAAARASVEEINQMAVFAEWRQEIEQHLLSRYSDAVILGADASRVGNTLCFARPGQPSQNQVMKMDLRGLAVSAGSACSSGKVKPSHVATAMGFDDIIAGSVLRLSFGWSNRVEDVAVIKNAL